MLKDIECQPKALKILKGMLKKDKIPSAMLMCGQKGIGKRFAAVNYLKALNCLNPVDFDSCDKCLSCKKIDSGVHPDIHIIEPINDEIKIDNIRKIEELIAFKPFEGRKKIVLVDDSEKMNPNAANALLKTLEEPPENTLIILISSNEDLLPDTIKSRCIRIGFFPLPSDACKRLISSHVNAEDINLYLNLAMGRPGIAINRNFSEEKKWFMSVLQNMINDSSKEAWSDREQMKQWFDLSYIFIRDMIVYEITENHSYTIFGEDFRCKAIKNALDVYEELQRIGDIVDFNLNKSITWNYTSGIMKSLIYEQS